MLTPEITGAIVEMTKLRAGLGGTCNEDCGCTQEDGSSGGCGIRGRRLLRNLGGLQVSTVEVEKMRGWWVQGVSFSGDREEPELALRGAGVC